MEFTRKWGPGSNPGSYRFFNTRVSIEPRVILWWNYYEHWVMKTYDYKFFHLISRYILFNIIQYFVRVYIIQLCSIRQVSNVWRNPIPWYSASLRNPASTLSLVPVNCISKFAWKIWKRITHVSRSRSPIPSCRTEKRFPNSPIKCVYRNPRTNTIVCSWWLVRCQMVSLRTLTV